MSRNVDQVYITNPSTSAPGTALIYLGLSPYGATNDSAILVSDFLKQVPNSTVVDVVSSTQALANNTIYITDNGVSLVTYTLPSTAALGTVITIIGKSAGGFTIAQNAGQSINLGNKTSTVGVGGSISSTNLNDNLSFMCVTANTTWSVISATGNLTIV